MRIPFTTRFYRTWWMVVIPVVILSLVVTWFLTREQLPRVIRIATSDPDSGLYYRFAEFLRKPLEEKTGRKVELIETQGTVENARLLREGKAHLAILQAGAVSMDDLAGLVPLYQDVVFVVVRKGSNIDSVTDLKGRRLVLGFENSGMLKSATKILDHYGLEVEQVRNSSFGLLLTDQDIDGAIITTGLMNRGLQNLLETGDFEILPIDGAAALALRHSYFTEYRIPKGFFSEGPAVPPEPVLTVATMSFLAAHKDAAEILVRRTLEALYENDLRADNKLPTLMPYAEAEQWRIFPMHHGSLNYFAPYKGLRALGTTLESLAGAYELLFALVAGMYLLWRRREQLRRRRRRQAVDAQNRVLDAHLKDTVKIERMQIKEFDPERLNQRLLEVTQTKLQALEELTHEDLTGDRKFLIFLNQCDGLSRKIQSKIALYSETKRTLPPEPKKPTG